MELRRWPDHREQPNGRPPLLGRTLKDVFQRYKALQGFHQRYQNGFDCQGLWVEVNVERQLGLNSKREIEDYGLAAFAGEVQAVGRRVLRGDHRPVQAPRHVDGLGQRLLHVLDTNIEYIWRFLKTVHERGWALHGAPLDVWCPRCGTSISQHELIGLTRIGATRRSTYACHFSTTTAMRSSSDDDALDAACERRRRRRARGRVREAFDRRRAALGRRGAARRAPVRRRGRR